MSSNSFSDSTVEAMANRIAASSTLYEQGGKSAYYLQCYDAKIEQDEVLVAAYDWRGNGTVPVLIFAREDGLTRRTKAQILFTPELIGEFLTHLNEAFPEILDTPTGVVDEEEMVNELTIFTNGDFGDVVVAVVHNGLHRDLVLGQEGGGPLSLPFVQVKHLAQGLRNAYQAYVEHPYS